MKMNLRTPFLPLTAMLLCLSLFAGCAAPTIVPKYSPAPATPAPTPAQTVTETVSEADTSEVAGTLLLSVNPEIEIEYDHRGLVIEIEGLNNDGKAVAGAYKDYKGKDCDTVVNELVKKIYDSGFFETTIGGQSRNIVIKLEDGSVAPDDTFLDKMAQGVRDTVAEYNISSKPMLIDKDDFADNGYIGLEKAKELVLAQLGLDEATFRDKEYELDDGVYELEFTSGGMEYEYEVHAVTGKILEADRERNDDWDDIFDDDWDDKYDDDWDDRYDDDDRDDRYDDDWDD